MMAAKKYGYKKKKRVRKSEFVCDEPQRPSVYDILQENMLLLQRNVYVHRIIYIGTHYFAESSNLARLLRENIDQVNALYNEEFLSGFLLYYTRHFMHVVDGSEDSIRKHLDLLFASDKLTDHIDTVKILVVYNNINQRFMTNWMEMSAKPPHLLERIKSDTDAVETRSKILNCITKLYKFALLLKATEEDPLDTTSPPTESIIKTTNRKTTSFFESPGPVEDFRVASILPSTISDNRIALGSRLSMTRFQHVLPELQLIEFLVETQHTLDIQEYMKCYGYIPMLYQYLDYAWPVATDFIPRNVFDLEYDPVRDVFEPTVSVQLDAELINV